MTKTKVQYILLLAYLLAAFAWTRNCPYLQQQRFNPYSLQFNQYFPFHVNSSMQLSSSSTELLSQLLSPLMWCEKACLPDKFILYYIILYIMGNISTLVKCDIHCKIKYDDKLGLHSIHPDNFVLYTWFL